MSQRCMQLARIAAVTIIAISTGLLCAAGLAIAYVFIAESLWPLEPYEAPGAQFGRGMAVLGLALVGFIGGCTLAAKGYLALASRFRA